MCYLAVNMVNNLCDLWPLIQGMPDTLTLLAFCHIITKTPLHMLHRNLPESYCNMAYLSTSRLLLVCAPLYQA